MQTKALKKLFCLMTLNREGTMDVSDLACLRAGSRREPPQLLSMYCAASPEEPHAAADAFPAPGPSQQQDHPLESPLRDSPPDDKQTGNHHPDVLASQYGSSSQLQSSQRPLSQVKLEHAPGMFGTQASQATPAEPLRSPMADAADLWPVSWHANTLASQSSPGQGTDSRALAKSLQGRICAASMGSGDVLLYSFACGAPEVEVHAWPPAGSQVGATSDASQPAAGGIKVTPIVPAQRNAFQPGRDNEQQAQGSKPDRGAPEQQRGQQKSGDIAAESSAGFTWKPVSMTATYAQGLPRRICWPLKATER